MHQVRFVAIVSILIASCSDGLMAQPKKEQHVEWIVSVSKLANGSALVVMNALIDRGWHLYSMRMEEDGPPPTTIKFSLGKYQLNGDVQEFGTPVTVFDSTFQMNITWYEENVVFTQKIQYRESEQVSGEIGFMVCSSSLCIPGEVRFTQTLP
jgi:thiol:disulfide interchange protein DsbD